VEKKQKFRANRVGLYVNVQALAMYVVLMCSLKLPSVEKTITSHIRGKLCDGSFLDFCCSCFWKEMKVLLCSRIEKEKKVKRR